MPFPSASSSPRLAWTVESVRAERSPPQHLPARLNVRHKANGHSGSRVSRSGRRPNLEDPARAEKEDVECLEEVELSEHKRNLIGSRPGQNETDGRKLSDNRLDNDAAGLHLRKGSR